MTVGQQVEFWQGAGDFRRLREGVVSCVMESGKIQVKFLVGGDETYATVTVGDLVAEPPARREIVQPVALEEPESAIGGDTEPLPDDITKDTIIEPVMYDESVLGPKPRWRVLQRHHVGDARYYVVRFEENGRWSRPQLYAGVTSVTKAVMPRSKNIEEWMCGFGSYDAAIKALDRAAAKGTVMHSLFARAMDPENPLPDFGTSEFDRVLRGMIHSQDQEASEVFGEWKGFMCKALLGFKQFCHDYSVEPLAVEIVLGQPHVVHEDGSRPLFGYFAQLDLLCRLDVEEEGPWGEPLKSGPNKGTPKIVKRKKRVVAIVDFKSGSGDYPEHDMQLLLQLPLVKSAFPHLVDNIGDIRIFNWHPTDFRTSSLAKKAATGKDIEFGYSLLEKENTPFWRGWADHHLFTWQKYHARELPMKAIYQGSPNIGVHPSENIRFADYPTYWEEKVARAIHHKFIEED